MQIHNNNNNNNNNNNKKKKKKKNIASSHSRAHILSKYLVVSFKIKKKT